MARSRRVLAAAILALAATVALSACTTEPPRTVYVTLAPGAGVSDAPSPSSTSSPSGATTTPRLTDAELLAAIPEEAWTPDFFGASAFAKVFMLEYRRAVNSGESTLFESMAAPRCTFCADALAERDEVAGNGGSVLGGDMTVEEDFAGGGDLGDGTWNATFGIAVSEAKYVGADGAVYETVPAMAGRVEVLMRFEGERWVVIDARVE